MNIKMQGYDEIQATLAKSHGRRSLLIAILVGMFGFVPTLKALTQLQSAKAFSDKCRYQYCEFATAYFECHRPWLIWNEVYVCIDLFTSEFCGVLVRSTVAGCC